MMTEQAVHTMLVQRGWTTGADGRLYWKPQRRTRWMPEGEQEDVLICEETRVRAIKPVAWLPICYLGPAQDELAAIQREAEAVRTEGGQR